MQRRTNEVSMRVALAGLALCSLTVAGAANAATRPVVVELFTSEGCSSCPPADAYLSTLAGRIRRPAARLPCHLLELRSAGATRSRATRRRAGRRCMPHASAAASYTPEMVVDGRRGMVGSDRGEVASAIAEARGDASDAVPIKAGRSGRGITVSLGAGGGKGRVMLVGFDPRHTTQVGRGENSGADARRIEHRALARDDRQLRRARR